VGWSLRGLPRRGCAVRLIGQVTAILGAIASANLVLILLDMARVRPIDNPISADNARGKLQAGDASRRCDALIGVRRIRSGTHQPVATSGETVRWSSAPLSERRQCGN